MGLPLTARTIHQLIEQKDANSFFEAVIVATERAMHLKTGALVSRSRDRRDTDGRRLACWIAKRYMGANITTPLMGDVLGGREHSSVLRYLQDFNPLEGAAGRNLVRDTEIELHKELLHQGRGTKIQKSA